jgi:hypothetical protein
MFAKTLFNLGASNNFIALQYVKDNAALQIQPTTKVLQFTDR